MYFASTVRDHVTAIYTGRFAFIPNSTADAVRAWFADSRAHGDQFSESLAEEWRHANDLMNTRIGLVLGGLRIQARFRWLLKRDASTVRRYYRLRTAFYRHYYPLFEHAARTGAEIDPREADAVDRDVRDAWRTLLQPREFHCLSKIEPVLCWLGYRTARHFCVITNRFVGGQLVEENVSLRGLTNAYSSAQIDARWWLTPIRYLQIESWKPKTFKDDWHWLHHKFAAEYDCWDSVGESRFPDRPQFPSFDEYKKTILRFSMSWSRAESASVMADLLRAIAAATYGNICPVPAWNAQENRKIVNFFYLHGN